MAARQPLSYRAGPLVLEQWHEAELQGTYERARYAQRCQWERARQASLQQDLQAFETSAFETSAFHTSKGLRYHTSSLRDLEPHAAHRASCGESSLAERAGKTDGRAPFTENHARVGRLTLDGK